MTERLVEDGKRLEIIKENIASNRIASLTRKMQSMRKMMVAMNEVDEVNIELEFVKRFLLFSNPDESDKYTKSDGRKKSK